MQNDDETTERPLPVRVSGSGRSGGVVEVEHNNSELVAQRTSHCHERCWEALAYIVRGPERVKVIYASPIYCEFCCEFLV